MYDLCVKCGSNEHYVNDCVNDCVETWVDKFGGKLSDNIRKCYKCSKIINDKPIHYRYCSDCYN